MLINEFNMFVEHRGSHRHLRKARDWGSVLSVLCGVFMFWLRLPPMFQKRCEQNYNLLMLPQTKRKGIKGSENRKSRYTLCNIELSQNDDHEMWRYLWLQLLCRTAREAERRLLSQSASNSGWPSLNLTAARTNIYHTTNQNTARNDALINATWDFNVLNCSSTDGTCKVVALRHRAQFSRCYHPTACIHAWH